MAVLRLLIALGLMLIAAGAAFIMWSASMERFREGNTPLYELIDRQGDGAFPGKSAWYREMDALRTDKDALFDFGGSLITTAVVLLLVAAMKASNKGRLRTPSSRVAIIALFAICYVGTFYVSSLAVHWDVVRHTGPPWIETLQPQYGLLAMSFVLFVVPLAIALLGPLFRRVELPIDLVDRRASAGSMIAAMFYGGLCFVFAAVGALAFGTSDFLSILPLAGLAYLALCAGAIATKKAEAITPAFASNY